MTITGKLTELFDVYDNLIELKGWYKAAADSANPMSSLQYRAEGMSRGIAEALEKLQPIIRKLENTVTEITRDMLPEAV